MICICTDPVVVVVISTWRVGPVLSGKDVDASMPDTRDAEHEVLVGDTLNHSVIVPLPSREVPARSVTVTVPSAVKVAVSDAL